MSALRSRLRLGDRSAKPQAEFRSSDSISDAFDDVSCGRNPVEGQNPVEMVEFVLNDAGREIDEIERSRLTLGIQVLNAHGPAAFDQDQQFRKAQTAFPGSGPSRRKLGDAGIDESFNAACSPSTCGASTPARNARLLTKTCGAARPAPCSSSSVSRMSLSDC